jgi:hypothetical protein
MGRDTLGIKLDNARRPSYQTRCVLARSIGFLEKPFQIDAVVVGVIGEGRSIPPMTKSASARVIGCGCETAIDPEFSSI